MSLSRSPTTTTGRIGQQFTGSLDPSQPAHALLVLNRPLTPWRRLELVVTGPDPCVEQTENSLRLAVDGDLGMDEKPRRNPVAGRAKPAAIGRAAGEIDLGRVLRDDNVPTRARRERAPRKGRQRIFPRLRDRVAGSACAGWRWRPTKRREMEA
jgi:hypothetical protein